MKYHKRSVQALVHENMSKVLRLALLTVMALFMTNGLAQSFNGFASYQDYLDNFYAGQNAPTTSVYPCGYQNILSLLVYGNDNCPPQTNVSRSYTQPYTDTTPFNGYPSYQAYLDAFYAGTISPRTPPNTSVPNNYYGYNSYNEFIQAVYGNGTTVGPRSGVLPHNNYYSYGSYDAFMQAIYGNTTFGPRSGIAPTLPPTPSTSLSGFFEFSVGQSYQFSNGLVMTVETLNDNRCPQNVQCVWQGDIAATIRLALGNDIRNITVSMVAGAQAPEVVVSNASIQFVGLGQRVNNANTLNAYISMN